MRRSAKHESRIRNQNGVLWVGGYCLLPVCLMLLSLLMLSGCSSIQRNPPLEVWDDMDRQGKFKPQGETSLPMFGDRRAARRPVEGTVARGHLREETPYNTGTENGLFIGKNPRPVTMELMSLGQTRFNTYCSPCHDRAGTGAGIVPSKALAWQPSNLTDDRIRGFNDGEIFYVMTNGRRTMPAYKFQVTEDDRWAIVAYVRALQRAAAGTIADVPEALKTELR